MAFMGLEAALATVIHAFVLLWPNCWGVLIGWGSWEVLGSRRCSEQLVLPPGKLIDEWPLDRHSLQSLDCSINSQFYTCSCMKLRCWRGLFLLLSLCVCVCMYIHLAWLWHLGERAESPMSFIKLSWLWHLKPQRHGWVTLAGWAGALQPNSGLAVLKHWGPTDRWGWSPCVQLQQGKLERLHFTLHLPCVKHARTDTPHTETH